MSGHHRPRPSARFRIRCVANTGEHRVTHERRVWGDKHWGPRADWGVPGSEHGDHILLHKLRGDRGILIIVEDLLIRDVRGSGTWITGQAKLRAGWVSIRAVGVWNLGGRCISSIAGIRVVEPRKGARSPGKREGDSTPGPGRARCWCSGCTA